jgi:hypothetical protein
LKTAAAARRGLDQGSPGSGGADIDRDAASARPARPEAAPAARPLPPAPAAAETTPRLQVPKPGADPNVVAVDVAGTGHGQLVVFTNAPGWTTGLPPHVQREVMAAWTLPDGYGRPGATPPQS